MKNRMSTRQQSWLEKVRRQLICRIAEPRRSADRRKPRALSGAGFRGEMLEARTVLSGGPFDVQAVIGVYNQGLAQVQQIDSVTASINSAFGTDLPLIQETIAQVLDAADDIVGAFSQAAPTTGIADFAALGTWLTEHGFTVQYAGANADAQGDLLRINWHAALDNSPNQFSSGGSAGFDYLSNNAGGNLTGSLTTNFGSAAIDATFGIDVVNDTPTFFVREGGGLTFSGLSAQGTLAGNIGIGFLLNVNATGTFNASAQGSLTFKDSDADGKLRVADFSAGQFAQAFDSTLTGSVTLAGSFTSDLPILGDLTWGVELAATIAGSGVSFGSPSLTLPSIDLANWVQSAANSTNGSFNLFGGSDGLLSSGSFLSGNGLGAIGASSLSDLLGIPTDLFSGLGLNLTSFDISPATILDLIQGKRVDILELSTQGGDHTGDSKDFLLAAFPFAIGPIPFSVNLSATLGYDVGYEYFAGIGVDTMGVYIDPMTHFRAWGGAFAGVKGDLALAGLFDLASIEGGLGLQINAGVGLKDPDPSDGRIYLDEIVRTIDDQGNSVSYDLAESLARVMYVALGGEAYGYAKAGISLPWPLPDITLFDTHWTIGQFGTNLGTESRSAQTPSSTQKERLRGLPVETDIPAQYATQSGNVLTLHGDLTSNRNYVDVKNVAGGIQVAWSSVGKSVYSGITEINYTGNDQADWFNVEDGVSIQVSANGAGGNDYFQGGMLSNTIHGGLGDDQLFGGSASDSLYGDDGNDLLRAGAGNDTLDGGAGSDDLHGDDGIDSLLGGDGDDALDGGIGGDILLGQAGKDFMSGGQGDDSLEGGSGENYLFGNDGQDTLVGGNENDTLLGGDGSDTLQGGDGNDLLMGDDIVTGATGSTDSGFSIHSGNDLLEGQAGNDTLYGGEGNDTLYGDQSDDGGNDVLYGDAGDDVLYGGSNNGNSESGEGADTLFGGDGNDSLDGERGPDLLNGQKGTDTVQGGYGDDLLLLDLDGINSSTNDVLDGGIDQDTLAVEGSFNVTYLQDTNNPNQSVLNVPSINDNVDDVIGLSQIDADHFQATRYASIGGAVTDSMTFFLDHSINGNIERLGLYGLGGNDYLYADPGVGKNLVIDGGAGNDTLVGAAGRDSIVGGDGDDSLMGATNDDVLNGGAGLDTLLGEAGSDVLYGDSGDDVLSGGDGRDVSYGGAGNDSIDAGAGIFGDLMYGGADNDTIQGGAGLDVIRGEAGDDALYGDALTDNIDGGAGNDTIEGGSGRDFLFGGDGQDVIYAYTQDLIDPSLPGELDWLELYQQPLSSRTRTRSAWRSSISPLGASVGSLGANRVLRQSRSICSGYRDIRQRPIGGTIAPATGNCAASQ